MKKISLLLTGVLLFSVTTNVFASGLTIEEIVKGSTPGSIIESNVETINQSNSEKVNAQTVDSKNESIGKFNIDNIKKSTNTVKEFKDVPKNHWAYNSIMDMVNSGIIAGTTTPVDGIGTFSPDSPMTKAQFITIVTRFFYPNEVASYNGTNTIWYESSYRVAEEKRLFLSSATAFMFENMNQSMTREEMAYVLGSAIMNLNVNLGLFVNYNEIPDYEKVYFDYRLGTKVVYTKGIIAGVDSNGTFNPKGTLTRAQAATIFSRLIKWVEEENSKPKTITYIADYNEKQIFHEGEPHQKPKAGDIVVKSDGTQEIIDYDEFGILRGKGCDIYTGVVLPTGKYVREGMASYEDMRVFRKDSITGEMLSMGDWNKLKGKLDPTHIRKGNYDGEIMNTWFEWDTQTGLWVWIGASQYD